MIIKAILKKKLKDDLGDEYTSCNTSEHHIIMELSGNAETINEIKKLLEEKFVID
jgi:hypothetical protein